MERRARLAGGVKAEHNQWRRRRRDGRSDGCANDGKGERRPIGARRGAYDATPREGGAGSTERGSKRCCLGRRTVATHGHSRGNRAGGARREQSSPKFKPIGLDGEYQGVLYGHMPLIEARGEQSMESTEGLV